MKIMDLNEKAPKGKKAARFIRKARDDFKDRYGKAWKSALYATAWKMFGESLNEMDAPSDMRAWLQGTQCVDGQGKPLVMYHGVPHDYAGFERFDDTHQMGHFFTSDPDYAARYAEKPIHDDHEEDTGALYAVYLSLKNPLVIDENDEEGVATYTQHGKTAAALKAEGYDGMMIRYADGEVEAMVVSSDQIVSAVQARPQLHESTSDEQDSLRAVMDAFADWRPSNTPQCWMDWMPGDLPNELEIDSLNVEPEARHQGQGGKAMAKICQLADQHDVILTLLPSPNPEEGPTMDFDALCEFYKRFGFRWDMESGSAMMKRLPARPLREGHLVEGLLAVPPAMQDQIEFLMTYHYLWWAKWQIKKSGQEWPELSAAIEKEARKLGDEIPDSEYHLPNDVSVNRIPVSVEGLPASYAKLQPRVTSILFGIVWGMKKDLGGWLVKKNALVMYPSAISYMDYWPSQRSHPEDIMLAVGTLKSTIEHELRHMVQYVFLGDHKEQTRFKAKYNAGGSDYYTSPVELDPTIGSVAREFVSLYGLVSSEKRTVNLPLALSKFVGAKKSDSFDPFATVSFFKHLKAGAPVRYRTAVKKFVKEVARLLV